MAITFTQDVLPLFRPGDIACMGGKGVILNDAGWMCDAAGDSDYPDHANARRVFEQLSQGRMPPDSAWSKEPVATYQQWMSDGFTP